LGSGCIYEGRKNGTGFSEEDHPNFGWSVYSVSKQFVEKKLKGFPDVLQLRIRMPLDCIVHPRNLITKLLGYDRILDEPNSVSYVPDVIRAARWLVEKDASGVYNVVNGGELRHPELLDTYQKLSGRQLSYRVINHKELDDMTAAKRSNCILSNEKLISTGFIIPDIKVAMPAAVALYVDHERQLETSR
ncbi:MAG: hypothetical protein WCK90_06395, partial [archaeon]